MKIQRIKQIDAIIGRLFVTVLPNPAIFDNAKNIASLLLIRPGGIGDAVLLAPTVYAIKKNNPKATITLLAERRNIGIFMLIPGVTSVLRYDSPREFTQALRGRYDVVIDTEQWHRLSAVVARLVRAPVKIGFDTNERRRMFTHTISYSHNDYEAVSFAHLVEPLGIGAGSAVTKAPFLMPPVSAAEKAVSLLKPLDGKRFVVIFPGASIPERRWGAERYGLVAQVLFHAGYPVVVVGSKGDKEQGDEIVRDGVGLNLAGLTSLVETAAILSRSSLLLSGDSGVLHIAVGLGISTVSLFGPGIAAKWAPRGEKHIVINRNLPCSPCTKFGTTPPCPYDARCMKEITADQVVEAAVRLLQKKPK